MDTEWLAFIKKTTPDEGEITTKDDLGNSLILEWTRSDILSPILASFKNSISDLASEELASVELHFLRKHPEAASQELFLKDCMPLLENGIELSKTKQINKKGSGVSSST